MVRLWLKIIWNALAIVTIGLLILWFLGLFPPNSKVTAGPPILESIKHVNKQIFIEHYNAVDITYTDAPDWISLFGIKQEFIKQEFIVLIRGRVPAGFDLQGLSEKDVWVSSDGKRVQLTLPSPIVFKDNVFIDFENSRILAQSDTCPNLICEDNLVAYQSQVMPQGRDKLIEFALKNGILEQAAKDGKEFYEQLLKSLGFEEVKVVVNGYGV
jgi:hypothetical protein